MPTQAEDVQARDSAAVCNVAAHLPRRAAERPEQPALIVKAGAGRQTLSYAELEAVSSRFANGLQAAGIERGMRTLVMVRPGLEFIGLAFALFKVGAVPILIDPGMGVRQMRSCIRTVEPEAFIGIPAAQVFRKLGAEAFRTVRHIVTVGRRLFWGGPTLAGLAAKASDRFEMAATRPEEVAAILFTSGSTGPAKGVVYEHGMFDAQVRWIQAHYGIEPGEVDLCAFPLFALFGPAMGMTSVVPDMNPTKPAKVNAARLVGEIGDYQVTNSFGSPALWKRVAAFCLDRGAKLSTVRRILIAGAPVAPQLMEQLRQILPAGAEVHTPYGATESLPLASITATEVLGQCAGRTRQGAGICVGQSFPDVEVRVIRITDEPIAEWSDDLELPAGEIGEITVRSAVTTKAYYGLPEATAGAKIRDGDTLWHRMGDVGYRDEEGRLWFCGRKAHRVDAEPGTMFSVRCEAVFNEHPDVYRSALVGIGPRGRQRPAIVIEPEAARFPRGSREASLRAELLELGRANELTRDISEVLFHRAFPVDVRHNVKINREALAVWAAERLR